MVLQLDQMTTRDKIRAMELLWDDLCKHANAVASPSWHKDILSQREKSVAKGKEKFNDWDGEKERIKKSCQ
ncbi:MAG: addiction module protein [Nitrospirae bacterium]|nr:addiction module protein [Nitrospirota bacterium]